MRVVLLEMKLERRTRVDEEGVDVEQDVAFWEALVQRLDAGGGDGALHHLLGVLDVEDGEVRPVADGFGMTAQEAVADGGERASPVAAGGVWGGATHPPESATWGRVL